ncbi:MAG: hypothetical protein P1U65_05095 [Minwuia sp.]|nr:hypothetical protein [Minwuia sp.]
MGSDLRAGLAIIRATWVAVAVFVLFGTGVTLAFNALSASLLSDVSLELPLVPGFLSALILDALVEMIVPYLLILFMIEIAAIGGERLAGKDSRMQLVFKLNVAWSLLVAAIFSTLIITLLGWLLQAFMGVVLLSLFGDTANQDSGSVISTLGLIGIVQHLLILIVLAFGISRFALIPVIARHHAVGFGEAWRLQTHGFDNYYGSVRNRFFRVLLVLLVIEAVIALAVTSGIGDGFFTNILVSAVSVFLLTVWAVAILTCMVRSQPEASEPTNEDTQDH